MIRFLCCGHLVPSCIHGFLVVLELRFTNVFIALAFPDEISNSIYKTIRSKMFLTPWCHHSTQNEDKGAEIQDSCLSDSWCPLPIPVWEESWHLQHPLSASILPPRTVAVKSPGDKGEKMRLILPLPFRFIPESWPFGLKIRAGPIGGKLHSLSESCLISQLTLMVFSGLGPWLQNHALHSFPGFS